MTVPPDQPYQPHQPMQPHQPHQPMQPHQPHQPQPPGSGPYPGQQGAAPGPYGPLKVRYNPVFGAIAIAIGVLNIVLANVNDYSIGWFPGIVLTILGVLYCVGTALEVDQQSARVKSPVQLTMKNVPIHGVGDLVFEGKVLFRAGDHHKIANLGWGSTRGEDIERLQAAIAQARSPMAPPPAQG